MKIPVPFYLKFWILFISLLTLLSSCGFHFRNAESIPEQLHTLYFDTPRPNDPFSIQLRNLLQSLKIHLVSSPNLATARLTLIGYNFAHSVPKITSSNEAVSYRYRLSVTLQLANQIGKPIAKKKINSSHSLKLSVDQIYIPNTANVVEQQLRHDILNKIYYWLTTENTRAALAGHPKPQNESTSSEEEDDEDFNELPDASESSLDSLSGKST